MTSRVFVPLVDARGEAAHLFEAIAGEIPPEAHPARLVPQIAELFDFGLYGVGQSAREAVTSFVEARRRRLWLSPRNAALKPWHLRISDLQLGKLSDGNARSAGFGLTIAALCQTFGRNPGIVFATGEVLSPDAPDKPARVGPVSGVRGKLALIGDYLFQRGSALEGARVIVALPAEAEDGRPTQEAERAMLARLAEQAKEARARLDVVFAHTLDDLEPALGPFVIPELVTPRRAIAAAAALAVAALGFGAWSALAHAPIRLAFEPPAAGEDEAAPQRARYRADKLELLGPCYDSQHQPLVVGGETLVVKVRAEDALPYASRVRPMRLFIASVSRNADPVILDAAHFRTLMQKPSDSNDLVAAIPIEPVEDEVRLFVLATRDPKLAISEIESSLRATLKGLTGASALAATTTFLADRVGSEIAYQFRVTNDKAPAPLKRLALALAVLAAPAQAAPARLDSDAEIDAFAARVEAYASASLVRWTVVAPTHAAAQAKIDAIVAKLPADDRGLAGRLIAQESPEAKGASAYVSPQIGASGGGSCSWQVWVTDPALPTADDRVAAVPLAPRDRLPVSAQATFRVGHFGLVQSKLYAFDETDAGAIRDLAAAPTDIPVPKDGGEDHVVLASARTAAPFLEDVKAALAASQGERRDLGPQYALRGKLYAVRESQLGAARGIGANIEAVPETMISTKATKVAAAETPAKRDEALMETCLFALTPSR